MAILNEQIKDAIERLRMQKPTTPTMKQKAVMQSSA